MRALLAARRTASSAYAGREHNLKDVDVDDLFGVVYVLDEPSAGLHASWGAALQLQSRAP